jgi:predicted NUDIX family NTP pyrophosphohydrolase
MELEILKKKLSTYRNARDQVRNVPDELLIEVLTAWERWTGTTREFYRQIGISHAGMASMMGKAKKLKREGRVVVASEFQEVGLEMANGVNGSSSTNGSSIEMVLEGGRILRFPDVEKLIDFLKKAA